MKLGQAVRTAPFKPLRARVATIRQAVNSPQGFHLGHALGQCSECDNLETLLKSRAYLALLPRSEARQLARKHGLQLHGDDPMSRIEALAILGIGERAVPRVVARLRACAAEATKRVSQPLQRVPQPEPDLVPA